jgi:PTS HPr component family protein
LVRRSACTPGRRPFSCRPSWPQGCRYSFPSRTTRELARGVDARSILAVLALDVACGDEVELATDGERADDVLASLAALLAAG